jgi:pimeloyl-ACP methyl ester carboxylesterase
MQHPLPFVREVGSGPGVVCLHANASSSSQWRGLSERLAPSFHVLTPDSYGSGKSPRWPDRTIGLADEAALLEPVFAAAGEPFVLVGHSYGGAVALVAAAQRPGRVRALVLYEPTLFALVNRATPPPNDVDGIRETVQRAGAELDAGRPAGAAECFIDFWMGPGSFSKMPETRRPPILASIVNVRGWGRALLEEPTPLEAFSGLDTPVLYMMGRHSPAPGLAVARLLTRTLPNVQVVEFEKLGHMGPVTHPDVVNDAIVQFVTALA